MNTNLKTGMKIMTNLKLLILSLTCVLYLYADEPSNSAPLCNSSVFIWINLPLNEYMQLSDKEKEQFTKDNGELMSFRGLNRLMNKNVYFSLTEEERKEIGACQMSSMFNGTIDPKKLLKMTDQERGKAILKGNRTDAEFTNLVAHAIEEQTNYIASMYNPDTSQVKIYKMTDQEKAKLSSRINPEIQTEAVATNNKMKNLLEKIISDESETTSVIFNQYIDDPKKLNEYRAAIIASNEAVLKIQKIIQNNFDIDSNIEFDQTLLMHASIRGNLKLTKILVEKNANLNLMKSWGFTSVTLASNYGHKEIVRYLIDHNADLKKGKPFILFGIGFNDRNIIDKYIEQGGNLNIQDNGNTCLVKAIIVFQNVTLDTIKYLVSKGADIHYITPDGRNLIQLAHDYGREDIAEFLNHVK
ncbi:ankyrin repeat domain-containing protein [Sulfuricurvum sp.]|uniref:ankyrin repeat domain-containing protein n=1 Tax=Sulfuricurvum sp. TaxID=2025608 RepID=UPI003BB711E6